VILISGIPQGASGTGRVLTYIVHEALRTPEADIRFIFGLDESAFLPFLPRGLVFNALWTAWLRLGFRISRALRNGTVIDEESVVLLHPQTLGFRRCMKLIERRSTPTWLYLMDSSFFCIRSYNYIPGEESACLRCLGGDFTSIGNYGCKPSPLKDSNALEFVKRLLKYVKTGHVKLLSQTKSQAGLARRHFGENAEIHVNGMWGVDWDISLPADDEKKNTAVPKYDVVFHGSPHPAKGADWAIALAERCKETRFLFPFSSGRSLPNCTFSDITWDSGLRDAVCSADIVLVPSLWSAPIEGALVKSIGAARAVAVVDNLTAFSNEIPEGMLLRLPGKPDRAAKVLKEALACNWEPNSDALNEWFASFRESNRGLIRRMLQCSSP
jgi:hypothetical protein